MDRNRSGAWAATACLLAASLLGATSAVANDLVLYTDHSIYMSGEDILVTVTNDSTHDILLFSSPPFLIRPAERDTTVAPCGWWTVIVELEPGQTRDYPTPQADCSTGIVQGWPDGLYEVSVRYQVGYDPSTIAEARRLFCIGGDCPDIPEDGVFPTTWGRLKSDYREEGP